MVGIKKYLIAALLVILSSALSAQSISVKAYTDTSDYFIGDYINLKVEITSDKNVVIVPTDIKKSLSNIDVLAEGLPEKDTRDGKNILTYSYTLSRYDSANVVLPKIPIKYGIGIDTAGRASFLAEKDTTLLTAYSNETRFTVHSLKVNEKEDIKDIKAPLTIPPDWRLIALWILIGIAVITAGYYFYRRYQAKKAVQPVKKKVITIPPHIRALEALKILEKEQLWQRGEIKTYHSRITEIIRTYYEERFQFPAMESSTTEILFHLNRYPDSGEVKGVTADFLNNADLVKFAKFVPMNSINEEMMKQARQIINSTMKIQEIKEPEGV